MRQTYRALTVGAALALGASALVACGSPMEPGDRAQPTPITELPRALSQTETSMISATNRFGFDLLAELTNGENLFMSPLSAHMALGMALNGAQDSTLAAMQSVLGFDGADTQSEINAAYAGLLTLLRDLDPAVTLELANSVWHEQLFPVRPSYLETVADVFHAEVGALDFADPASVDTINDWVDTKTNGRIKKMINDIDPAEVMFLLNAIYFKGDWTAGFDKDRTHDGSFERADGTTSLVRMMVRSDGDLELGGDANVRLIDLPYGGGAFRMTILLPTEGVTLASQLSGLDAAQWDSWMGSLVPAQHVVEMPRFTVTWESELRDALTAMGMGISFVPGRANFGGMLAEGLDPQAPGSDLHITRVKQKSFVEVNEEGTEAAAATIVGVGVTSAPLSIVVNRPFLFAIRERLSGTVLFLGVIEDPAAG